MSTPISLHPGPREAEESQGKSQGLPLFRKEEKREAREDKTEKQTVLAAACFEGVSVDRSGLVPV